MIAGPALSLLEDVVSFQRVVGPRACGVLDGGVANHGSVRSERARGPQHHQRELATAVGTAKPDGTTSMRRSDGSEIAVRSQV